MRPELLEYSRDENGVYEVTVRRDTDNEVLFVDPAGRSRAATNGSRRRTGPYHSNNSDHAGSSGFAATGDPDSHRKCCRPDGRHFYPFPG